MSPAIGTLTEPVATGLHTVVLDDRFSHRPLAEARALVIGAGAVGLSAALVLADYGCPEVVVSEANALRRATVGALGRCRVVDPGAGKEPEPGSVNMRRLTLQETALVGC